MFTKNIILKNFKGKNDVLKKKQLIKSLNIKNLIVKFPLLKTLTNNYKYSYNKKIVNSLKKYSKINIVGMGGSILGAQAIYDFLCKKINKNFFFYNTLQINRFNKTKEKKLNLIISKSGNTLETIANFNLLIENQKQNKNIIITEKKDNFLLSLANKLKIEVLEHNNYIGGRYSVLSEVGMLPAELMGLDEKI